MNAWERDRQQLFDQNKSDYVPKHCFKNFLQCSAFRYAIVKYVAFCLQVLVVSDMGSVASAATRGVSNYA